MKINVRKLSTVLLFGAFALSMSACNTMRGLGEDTEVAGDKIQKEADRHIDDKNKKDDRSRLP